jgi:hypothetical protein
LALYDWLNSVDLLERLLLLLGRKRIVQYALLPRRFEV